jgi:hypothetical protein
VSARSLAVTEQIRSAMASRNPDEIITGVKQAVAQEVSSLSPDAEIVVTEYFNHSYMPDLVLEWNDAGKRGIRPIFLRNDLRPEVTEVELEGLARREPVLLSLTALDEPSTRPGSLRERAREANHVLVTDVVSLADMAAPFDDERSKRFGQIETPLLRLVQANLLKGGRGLLTVEDAGRLASSTAPSDGDSMLTDEFIATFEETADEMFEPDAALRLRRSAELLRFGLTSEAVAAISESTGQLSDVELRILVPYLLADETARANTRLWSYIGSMMSLERLEELGDVLAGVDVTALVTPNVNIWTAKRAMLAINNSFEGLDETLPAPGNVKELTIDQVPEGNERNESFWYLRNRLLTADAGPWRLFIATDARRLKGRVESTAANWDDISPLIQGFALDSVDLRGMSRRIFVGAEGNGDVSSDVARIRSTIEDSFQVTEVRLRRIGDEESLGSLDVNFQEMTVTARYGVSPIASLIRAAELLGHRRPPDFSMLEGPPPAQETKL